MFFRAARLSGAAVLLVSLGAATLARAAEPAGDGKLATWESIGPGVLLADFSVGFSRSNINTDVPANAGGSGASSAGFGYLSVQAQLLSLFLANDFYADKRWRIEDYERLGVGLGYQTARTSSGAWFGVDYGAGAQGVFRVSNLVDVGARFYGAFFNDTNLYGLGKHSLAPYGAARVRIGNLHLEYTRQLGSNGGTTRLNIVEARYVFNRKDGKAIGLRVDFGSTDNGQPAPFHTDSFSFTTRLTYTYASF